jgi:thiol-disulfide isomerase/thioredoxin
MFPLLLTSASSERLFFTLDHDNFESTISSNPWVLVRFFTQHQEASVRSYSDYNLVGKSFANTSLLVAGLDCGKYRRDCLRNKAFDIPSVKLYGNGQIFKYEGGFSFESISAWARDISGIEPNLVTQLVATPNARTFRDMIDTNACVLAFFHTPWCTACKRFMPRLLRVARLFRDEPSIKFAEIDSDKYRSFIREYDLKIYPEVRLFVKGEKKPITFEDKRSPAIVTEFLNKYCGTRKEMSNIESQAGLLDDANAVLEEFFTNGRKPLYVQKMKAVPRASYYVSVLEGFLSQGSTYLSEQKAKLSAQREEDTTSQKEKDILTKKINIITFFEELVASSE